MALEEEKIKDIEEREKEDTEPAEMPDYEGDIISIIRSGISPKAMKNRLEDYHENDIAETLPTLTQEERVKLWRILDAEMIAEVFEHTEEDMLHRDIAIPHGLCLVLCVDQGIVQILPNKVLAAP